MKTNMNWYQLLLTNRVDILEGLGLLIKCFPCVNVELGYYIDSKTNTPYQHNTELKSKRELYKAYKRILLYEDECRVLRQEVFSRLRIYGTQMVKAQSNYVHWSLGIQYLFKAHIGLADGLGNDKYTIYRLKFKSDTTIYKRCNINNDRRALTDTKDLLLAEMINGK
jgi:hypothetical protein